MEQRRRPSRVRLERASVLTAALAGLGLLASCSTSPSGPGKQPPPPEPSVSQSVTLQDSINLAYMAEISNSSSATLKVTKDGASLLTKTVTGPSHSETFSYSTNQAITKGHYCFELQAGTASDSTCTDIPNYLPEVDLSGVDIGVNEESSLTAQLPSPTDENPEDHPAYTGIQELDGMASATLNGHTLHVAADRGTTGPYQVTLAFGASAGGESTATLSGRVYNLLDVNLTLKDEELNQTHPGILQFYNSNKEKFGEAEVGASGNVSERFPVRTDTLERILVQGRWIQGQDSSYVRTLSVAPRDIGTKTEARDIYVVPYGGRYPLSELDVTPEDFKRHEAEVQTYYKSRPSGDSFNWNPLIRKWDFGTDPNAPVSFKKVLIVKQNEAGADKGYFTETDAEHMKQDILNPNDLGAWFDGRIHNSNQIEIVDSHTFDYQKDRGKIVIYPQNTGTGGTTDGSNESYVPYANIVMNTGYAYNMPYLDGIHSLLMHELGHASGDDGHAYTIANRRTSDGTFYSNMNGGLKETNPFGPIDKKDVATRCQETYIPETGTGQKHDANGNPYRLLMLDDILGMSFFDSNGVAASSRVK